MEDYYVKVGKKYKRVGYSGPDMYDGLYYRQSTKYGSQTTSVAYWHGKFTPQPVDLQSLVDIMVMADTLSSYILNIQKLDSEEFKELKENSGGYVKEPPKVYNISNHDLSVAILRFIYEKVKEAKDEKNNLGDSRH